MVARMPKRQPVKLDIKTAVNADQLATEFGEVPETPEQRRKALREMQQSAMAYQNAIAAHDAREEQRMRMLSQRAKNPGNMLTMADLMGGIDLSGPPLSRADVLQGMDMGAMGSGGGYGGMLTEEFPTNKVDDYLMEEMYNQSAKQQPRRPVQRQPQRQALTETKPLRSSDIYRSDGSGRKVTEPGVSDHLVGRATKENWKVKRYIGETRSGNEVAVWRVENVLTGSKIDMLFRLEGVASRVAMYLNESGDNNDPRAVSLVNTYQRRDKLLKEARALEKDASGKPMKSERLRQIRAEINQLDYKLGV